VDIQDIFNALKKNYIFILMEDLDARTEAENACVEKVISKL
jgi:hypothetical protein